MAQNLTESPTFEATVPSIEMTDDVVGSTPGNPNTGVVNVPHYKILNRTKWLYDNKVNKSGDTISGLISHVQTRGLFSANTDLPQYSHSGNLKIAGRLAGLAAATSATIFKSTIAGLHYHETGRLKIVSKHGGLRYCFEAPFEIANNYVSYFIPASIQYIGKNDSAQQFTPVIDTGRSIVGGFHVNTTTNAISSVAEDYFDGTEGYLTNLLYMVIFNSGFTEMTLKVRNPSTGLAVGSIDILAEIEGAYI